MEIPPTLGIDEMTVTLAVASVLDIDKVGIKASIIHLIHQTHAKISG